MDTSYILVLTVCVLTLFGVGWVSKQIHGSWFFPGAFFPLLWSLYMGISFLLAPEFHPQILGVIMIVLFSIIVTVGANIISLKNSSIIKSNVPNLKTDLIFYTGLILSVISALGIGFVISMGFSWYQLEQSVFNLYILPNLFALERYNEVLAIPTNVKIVMFLTYPAALICGFVYPFLNGFRKWLSWLPILITMLYGTLFAVRSGILLSIILTFSGITCAKIYLGNDLKIWFHRVYVASTIMSLFLFSVFILLQWLRSGPNGFFFIDELIQGAKAGILGSFSAFTIWFSSYDFSQHLTLGLNTFAAPMEILGLTERASGFYTDFTPIGSSVTNIYSAFRGIIADFGIFGSFVYWGLFGLGSAIAYRSTSNGNVFAAVPLSTFYSFTLFSPLISIFTFNSIIISFIIFFGVLLAAKIQFS